MERREREERERETEREESVSCAHSLQLSMLNEKAFYECMSE